MGLRLQEPEGPPAGLPESFWSPPSVPLDEESELASFSTSSDPPSPVQHGRSSSSPVWDRRRSRRRAAARALAFLRQSSFSQHAVFCLLSGRPLVVVGAEAAAVRSLVDALSLFLPAPGPDQSAVMACLSWPLQLTDLLAWRLIGVHR